MNKDISRIIADWPYMPGEVTARKIVGLDGRDKVQLRFDLGLLQVELDGRPDGARPHGAESLLNFCEDRLRRHKTKHGDANGFSLSPAECAALRDEAVQYYFRYLAMLSLGEYTYVVRDTQRNLRLFDFMNQYAQDPSDRLSLEIYRPYALMTCTRAKAMELTSRGRDEEAVAAIDEGLAEIRSFFSQYNQEGIYTESSEFKVLNELRQQLQRSQKHPAGDDKLCGLRQRLEKAIAQEQFELAAKLRDEMRSLGS